MEAGYTPTRAATRAATTFYGSKSAKNRSAGVGSAPARSKSKANYYTAVSAASSVCGDVYSQGIRLEDMEGKFLCYS